MKMSLIYNISQKKRLIESYINKEIIRAFGYKGLIIIGCGRSGTTYTAKLFSQNGYTIGHERLKFNGIASWYLLSEQKIGLFGPTLQSIKETKFPIVHQVRSPIDSISSFQSIGKPSWEFIYNEKDIHINKQDSLLLKCMKYWYYWNLKAENKAIYTYRIENIENEIYELSKIAKMDLTFNNFDLSKKTNTRSHTDINWHDLKITDYKLTEKIIKLSKKYGYYHD